MASTASTIVVGLGIRIGANLAGVREGAGDRGVEHRLGQAAGEGVLLARVVTAEQCPAPTRASAPCPKRGRGRGTSAPSPRSARSEPSQAKEPRARIARHR